MLFIAVFAILPALGSVPDGLRDAIAARGRLGTNIWARTVRIERSPVLRSYPRGPYPQTVYGLVFELSGVLWFYTDANGTQSLSLQLGSLDADKADPGPLFRAVDPSFARWSWIDTGVCSTLSPVRNLPNGCFIESVAALFRRLVSGAQVGSPRLLSYYVDTPRGRHGHTVLLFGEGGSLVAVDPEFSERPIAVPASLGNDPRAISAFLWRGPVSSARTLAIDISGTGDLGGRLAALAVPGSREG